jgi:hypothetical protein
MLKIYKNFTFGHMKIIFEHLITYFNGLDFDNWLKFDDKHTEINIVHYLAPLRAITSFGKYNVEEGH